MKPDQPDFSFANDSFRLLSEETSAGERITREHEQRESDRAHNIKLQTDFLTATQPS